MKNWREKKGVVLGGCILAALLAVPVMLCGLTLTAEGSTPKVIIDPGHGGFDPGAIGVTGTHEDDLNLAVSEFLRDELQDRGVEVEMTRTDGNAISNTKTNDMYTRRNLISKSGAHCAIIIHMNSNQNASVRGPVSIYYSSSENGARLAKYIQAELNSQLNPAKKRTAYGESFFILKGGKAPSVIVECGFLSNRDEEWLLKQESYQKRLAVAIADGVCKYLYGEDGPTITPGPNPYQSPIPDEMPASPAPEENQPEEGDSVPDDAE